MVVVVLSDCPAKLRGDISKWMFEVNTGVYVGNMSARVRELLWKRICENLKNGQATMVYSARGEQKMEFCVHNTSWKIVDFDGIKLMQRPLPKHDLSKEGTEDTLLEEGFSNAAKFEKYRRIQLGKQKDRKCTDYVILDIETTGLSHLSDEIIEIAALRVTGGEPGEEFHSLVRCSKNIPNEVRELTGITDEDLAREGRELHSVLVELNNFISDSTLVCHNASFDLNFIQAACRSEGIEAPRNKCEDTLIIARRKLKGIKDYKLETIAQKLSVDIQGRHRALRDCYITYGIYTKLNEN
jgi:CRISPR-associated protein Cas2